jgi:transposase InsO family protein
MVVIALRGTLAPLKKCHTPRNIVKNARGLQAKLALFDYIECFYNTQRIHQSLNYLTPVEIEKRYYSQLEIM